ncbi:beta-1,6-N-acetylglucosaminyltransferase [Chitinophaga sp.]|uniref:beta-1,6-N-acetylglucosaminyltransferase n=1 Tax=Chitinophaga sp. TaxID=1869181 RepID=UPI002F947208
MKIAILIIAHKNFEQLVRLVRSLTTKSGNAEVTVYLHIDSDALISLDELAARFPDDANVFFIEPRTKLNWGGFSITNLTINLLNTAVNHTRHDYYCLISGMDFPLRPIEDLANYLLLNNGKEYIECFPMPDKMGLEGNGGMDRIDYYWLVDDIGIKKSEAFVAAQAAEKKKRLLPCNLTPFYGSTWFTLTHDCVESILSKLSKYPAILEFFRYTYISDELLIPTLVMNSSFADKVQHNNLRYINWTDGPEWPRVFRKENFDELVSCGSFFARKFDEKTDSDIIDRLEVFINQHLAIT